MASKLVPLSNSEGTQEEHVTCTVKWRKKYWFFGALRTTVAMSTSQSNLTALVSVERQDITFEEFVGLCSAASLNGGLRIGSISDLHDDERVVAFVVPTEDFYAAMDAASPGRPELVSLLAATPRLTSVPLVSLR